MSAIRVLKFGSSVLSRRSDLAALVHEVYAEVRAGHRVVAVVSAYRGATDRLDRRARSIQADSRGTARAALLATGERAAAAEVALAVERAGLRVEYADPAAIGLHARGSPLDAEPADLDAAAVSVLLERAPIVVVPGFFGADERGSAALFGRGGSDLSALFVAARLPGATVKLVKDVDGVYERDPAAECAALAAPLRYESLSHADALRIGGRLVQEKALRFAEAQGLDFEVGALGTGRSTRIGRVVSALGRTTATRPLRIALLGAGTVGGGVYRRLARRPDLYDVRRVLVRRDGPRADVPRRLLTTVPPFDDIENCDVVVELIGGIEPAYRIVRSALERGVDVVTANKELLAAHGVELESAASPTGARLLASASVGGAAPMLETTARAAAGPGVRALRGVLNGTTNFVLSRIERGDDLVAAVAAARRRGLCEADPSADLSGEDAARKLVLLARTAFGPDVAYEPELVRGIDALDASDVREAFERGRRVKLVASARFAYGRVIGRVEPVELALDDALASANGVENALSVELADGGRVEARGAGAGRWPTTEAVVGDLSTLVRERRVRNRNLRVARA